MDWGEEDSVGKVHALEAWGSELRTHVKNIQGLWVSLPTPGVVVARQANLRAC